MIRNVILRSMVLLVVTVAYPSCNSVNKHNSEVPNMRIDSNGKIVVSVAVDSVAFEMILDTGGGYAMCISDSVAAALDLKTVGLDTVSVSYGFEPEPLNSPSVESADTALTITIGNRKLLYDRIVIDNSVSDYGVDGILPVRSVFPAVWKIDFDANTVTVGECPSTVAADYAFDLWYDDNLGSYYIPELPMIFSSGLDSLLYESSCFIDTGSPYGLSVLGGGGPDGKYDELERFLERNAFGFSYWHPYPSGLALNDMFYIKEDMMLRDTLKVMCREHSGLSANILGMDFLFRFNIVLDIPSSKVYLTERKSAKSIDEYVLEQENSLMYTYSADDGKLVISSINRNSWLYKAGLRRFDRITEIDGQHCMRVRSSYLREKEVGDKVVFEVIRKGRVITITAEKTAQ